jgi:hypothetical protein
MCARWVQFHGQNWVRSCERQDAVWHAEQFDLHASGLMPMMTLLLPSHRPLSESDRERPRLHQNPASSMMRPR